MSCRCHRPPMSAARLRRPHTCCCSTIARASAARVPLFAKIPENPLQRLYRRIRPAAGWPPARVHPHVQGAFWCEAEAACRVHLETGNPDSLKMLSVLANPARWCTRRCRGNSRAPTRCTRPVRLAASAPVARASDRDPAPSNCHPARVACQCSRGPENPPSRQ